MADYGHELRFGIFVPPEAARGRSLLRLIQRADATAGLEVLAVQDHPYQPAFLDTWTLLSYVAAMTRTLTLMPAVANLPLRPPAVLARSAASLDLLSGGRVELGVGAGAFWDAIEAMGGQRRTPGQALTALREAMGVMRALWGEGRPNLEGEYYSLRGAKAGPAPAHRIGIWLGVYGPRALRMTGELADGWLGGFSYAPPDLLAGLMSAIDTGAREAGRVPALIRRAYIIDASMPVAQLTEVALAHGISEFLLPVDPDGEGATMRFAVETAPAVRAAVAAARVA
ncbi:LLM class flavin-dependent oxidoreductase [Nocardia sp. NBC_01327]|uniref:LLM class flavin-dependent oxidoreductase n=1 Tax=Nocardia sp. NBC_01327 TaxID=2903593 RepID=UPI002E159FAB|nr:LLM class flavin-dependent oxidoreductase [Nocardia sp. NBC_01327]